MQIVGIDFGTTNVRISTSDTNSPDVPPEPKLIGLGGSYTMPAVAALIRQPDGNVEIIVGDDADNLSESPNQLVLRNLKRCALASDSYVEQRLTEWDYWWDADSRCVQAWGREFPIRDLISSILSEALTKAEIEPGFEWVAGCPVHAGLEYRVELAEIVTSLGGLGKGEIHRVVEEPVLLLTLAYHLGRFEPNSSYLVYDLGGGSFDCALAQFEEDQQSDGSLNMVVYGAHGDPSLGGSDIDLALAKSLDHSENMNILRIAKEALSPANPSQDLLGGRSLDWKILEETVRSLKFDFKTTVTMREGYREAKVVWKRGDRREPVGEIVRRGKDFGDVRFVEQLDWPDMIDDIDGIILCGGPTKCTIFSSFLGERFGLDKLISFSDLINAEIPDPDLTGVSAGACYSINESHSPLFVNRLPIRVELEDVVTGGILKYETFEYFGRSPDGFISKQSLQFGPLDGSKRERFKLTATWENGIVARSKFLDSYLDYKPLKFKLWLIINRLGQIGVMQQQEGCAPHNYPVIAEDLPWQTASQRQAFEQLKENVRARKEVERIEFDYIQRSTLWI